MADWKDEARGIPVWVGAHVYHSLLSEDRPDIVTWFVDVPGFENWRVDSYVTCFHLDTYGDEWKDVPMVLALDNPDTQAAYLRRLAIRMGCPEEVAGEGVIATFCGGGLQLRAGAARRSPYNVWTETVDVGTDDRMLALVRAWRTTNDG